MKTVRTLSAVVALTLFAGCSATTDSSSPVVANATDPFTSAVVVKAEDIQGSDMEEEVLAEAVYEASRAVQSFVNRYEQGEIAARELDEAVDMLVSEHSQDPILRKVTSHLASHLTLKALLENEDTSGLEPHIARHTQVLLERNSPHAEDISRALKALDGYWAEEKIASLAKDAMEDAEDFLGRSVAHAAEKAPEDNPATNVPLEQLHENRSRANSGIGAGVQSLENILEQ